VSRSRKISSFEDKWSIEAQMVGGSTIGGKKTRGRRKRREPDTVVEPYQASYISMLAKICSRMP